MKNENDSPARQSHQRSVARSTCNNHHNINNNDNTNNCNNNININNNINNNNVENSSSSSFSFSSNVPVTTNKLNNNVIGKYFSCNIPKLPGSFNCRTRYGSVPNLKVSSEGCGDNHSIYLPLSVRHSGPGQLYDGEDDNEDVQVDEPGDDGGGLLNNLRDERVGRFHDATNRMIPRCFNRLFGVQDQSIQPIPSQPLPTVHSRRDVNVDSIEASSNFQISNSRGMIEQTSEQPCRIPTSNRLSSSSSSSSSSGRRRRFSNPDSTISSIISGVTSNSSSTQGDNWYYYDRRLQNNNFRVRINLYSAIFRFYSGVNRRNCIPSPPPSYEESTSSTYQHSVANVNQLNNNNSSSSNNSNNNGNSHQITDDTTNQSPPADDDLTPPPPYIERPPAYADVVSNESNMNNLLPENNFTDGSSNGFPNIYDFSLVRSNRFSPNNFGFDFWGFGNRSSNSDTNSARDFMLPPFSNNRSLNFQGGVRPAIRWNVHSRIDRWASADGNAWIRS
ncbi:hypothetical protein HELRODRAFT_192309 [Helobdella robusta]|uniref:Uncharacterized protein n=1 Tax=Helobdella robusta TaxID=6412 RepID=T1FTT4_HELRO|nr:hypothetical protein HELRODRAFT_192309 [Helobdella robusta]ESO01362.1 hypothetical protein HELRODRAFT_192309 [Helobdella robusta]